MKLYSIDDLKSSRIFFDKKPPAFLSVFILFTLLLLIGSLIVCNFLPKNYIVEAQGTITTEDNTYVGVLSDGVVMEIKKQENDLVKVGDILFTVSNGSEGTQIQAITKQLEQANEKKEAMGLYEKSLNDGVNYLKNDEYQQEYYGKMAYYLSIVNDENKSKSSQQTEINKKKDKLKVKKQELEALKSDLDSLKKQQEKSQNDEVNDQEANTLNENSQVESQISEKQSQIDSKTSEIESLESEADQYNQQSSSSQAEQTKLQLISELGTARTTLETNIVELEGQLGAYKKQDALTEIKATQNGYLHYLTPIKDGVSLQKSQTVAEISQNKEKQMIVEAYIQATDRSKVHVNDEVKVAIQGVNTQKYGTLKGKLTTIDSGTLTQETTNGNVVLYKCQVTIEEQDLKASNGEIIKPVKSMPVVARIVYEKETYMDWLLNMLNFQN